MTQTAVNDPVCGMTVDPTTSKHSYTHAGKAYYFCCAPCVEKFKANPEKYIRLQHALKVDQIEQTVIR